MLKNFSLIIILLIFTTLCRGQNNESPEKVTLKTGEVYIGNIILNSAELLIIKLEDGMRFQFQQTEVSKIENMEDANSHIQIQSLQNYKKIGGILELGIGAATAKNCFTTSPATRISLIFGQQNKHIPSVFSGIGIGYNSIFISGQNLDPGFLPLFFHIHSTLRNSSRYLPIIGIEGGYSFSLTSGFSGGPMAKILFGINHKINSNKSYILNLFSSINSIKGNITEKNNLGEYNYYGNSSVINIGVNIGLKF